jgi:hypothetical protein
MKFLLFVPLLVVFIPQQDPTSDGSSINVLNLKVEKARRVVEKQTSDVASTPQGAMIPQNKNFQRNVRMNEPAGVRDPNIDTIDGRSAAIDRSVQESRTPKTQQVDGYAYRVKVQNTSSKVVEVLFFEYQSVDIAAPDNVTRRQFLCGVSIRPGKETQLEGFSVSGPSATVNIESLSKKGSNPFQERIVINRVEYADGSLWQRAEWKLSDVKASYQRALSEKWVPGMCKGL